MAGSQPIILNRKWVAGDEKKIYIRKKSIWNTAAKDLSLKFYVSTIPKVPFGISVIHKQFSDCIWEYFCPFLYSLQHNENKMQYKWTNLKFYFFPLQIIFNLACLFHKYNSQIIYTRNHDKDYFQMTALV